MMVEVRQDSEEGDVTENHAAFARLANASAKLFAEQAAAMAAITAVGISIAGQMTGLMLGTYKPAEDKSADTPPVRETTKAAGTDGNVVPLRAKPEKRDGVAETEPKAEEAFEAAPEPKLEPKSEVEASKPEARANASTGDAEVKSAEVAIAVEARELVPEIEAKAAAPKVEAAEAAPKVKTTRLEPKVQAKERRPESKAKLDKGDTGVKPAQVETKAATAKVEPVKAAPTVASTKAAPKAEIRRPAPKAQAASELAQAGDDLKQISGLGPRLEKVLNARGITTYAQIAGMSKAALKKIDDELGLEGRVIRDDWAGQAKALAAGEA